MTATQEEPGPRVSVTVLGDDRHDVRDTVAVDTTWGTDGRLYARVRGERHALRCERFGGTDPGDDDWIRRDDGLRPGDRFFVYYDD